MQQLLFRRVGTDLLSFSRALLAGTALLLLGGWPLLASCFAIIAADILQSTTRMSSCSTKPLERWLLLSFVSTVASIGSWVLLFLATRRRLNAAESYQLWLCGKALQKLWGLELGYFLYHDFFKKNAWSILESGEAGEAVVLELDVGILQGRNVCSSHHRTSTPYYVKVNHGPSAMGKTYTRKTMDPVWSDQIFRRMVVSPLLTVHKSIECTIFNNNHGETSDDDDPMGTVLIPIPTLRNVKVVNWYPLEEGDSGELLVEIEVRSKSS